MSSGILTRTAARVPPLRRLHRRPQPILDAGIKRSALCRPPLPHPSRRVPLLPRPHARASAAARIAQQRLGLAHSAGVLPTTLLHRNIRSHAAGAMLRRRTRAAVHASHTRNSQSVGNDLPPPLLLGSAVLAARLHHSTPETLSTPVNHSTLLVLSVVCTVCPPSVNSERLHVPCALHPPSPQQQSNFTAAEHCHSRSNKEVIKQRVMESAPQTHHSLPPFDRLRFVLTHNNVAINACDYHRRR